MEDAVIAEPIPGFLPLSVCFSRGEAPITEPDPGVASKRVTLDEAARPEALPVKIIEGQSGMDGVNDDFRI
jgi:hypothetical protein